MKKIVLFTLTIFFIVASCSPIQERNESTPSPLIPTTTTVPITPTAVPLTKVEGYVFFDIDANGIFGDGVSNPRPRIVCPDTISVAAAQKYKEETGKDIFQALHTYFPGACDGFDRQIVTVSEVPIENYILMAKASDGTIIAQGITGKDGKFSISVPKGIEYKLFVVDPFAGNPLIEMKLTNIFTKRNTVPSQIVEGYIIPEMTLDHALEMDIAKGIPSKYILIEKPNIIGLTQGSFTAPACMGIQNYQDHDLAIGKVLTFSGVNKIGINIIYDNHRGTDFATKKGEFIFAMTSGQISSVGKGDSTPFGIPLSNSIRNSMGIITEYGHIMVPTVNGGQAVTRGQVIALTGITGTDNYHVHVNVKLVEDRIALPDPFGSYGVGSMWTINSVMVCPSNGQ